MIVGRQASVKRLDHAVRAIALAAERDPDLHVDMFGHGQQSQRLLRLGQELGVDEVITQHGYDPQGKQSFAGASFTLLCSKYEGFGLVLVEAMAAGCIPIAYDIDYGPRDIITDGVDGFLVPDGDVEALAAAIRRLRGLDAQAVERMRSAAIARARDYSPKSVTEQWGKVLDRARSCHVATRESPIDAELVAIDDAGSQLRLVVDVTGAAATDLRRAMVGWVGRAREAYGRIEARMSPGGSGVRLEAELDLRRFEEIESGAVLDVFVDLVGTDTRSRARIDSKRFDMPDPAKGGVGSAADRADDDPSTSIVPYSTVKGNLSLRRM